MGYIDKEPVIEIVKKYYPIANAEDTPLFQRVVDVCFFAGYYEQDIEEFCNALSDFSDESFQRGVDAHSL